MAALWVAAFLVMNQRATTETLRASQGGLARARQQALVSEFGQFVLGGGPVERLMREAAAKVVAGLNIALAEVLQLQPSKAELALGARVGWSAEGSEPQAVPADAGSLAGPTLAAGEAPRRRSPGRSHALGLAFLPAQGHAAGDAERGSDIADRWCAACHLVSIGRSAGGPRGPAR